MESSNRFTKILLLSAFSSVAGLLACSSDSNKTQPTQSVASIALTASSTDPVVSFGDTRTISAVAKDASGGTIASPSLTWSSSSPAVATVVGSGASATVTSVGNGTATITAVSGTVQGTLTVTVLQKATNLVLSGAPTSMIPGATAQLTADARDAKAASVVGATGFTFASSNQNIAVVNATGVVTAIAPGIATITSNATVGGAAITGTASISVAFATAVALTANVSATAAIAFAPATVTIATGGTVSFDFQTVTHNVTFRAAAGAPANVANTSSASVVRTFATPGTFAYDCTIHSGMTGTVVVRNPTAPAFIALLNGANERPTANSTTGGGSASFVVTGTTVAYTVTFAGLTAAPSAAHIHAPGNSTQSVGVLVDFGAAGQTLNNGVLSGTFTASNIRGVGTAAPISLDSLFALMRNGNAYVNVHTPQFPAGEIRGQVVVP